MSKSCTRCWWCGSTTYVCMWLIPRYASARPTQQDQIYPVSLIVGTHSLPRHENSTPLQFELPPTPTPTQQRNTKTQKRGAHKGHTKHLKHALTLGCRSCWRFSNTWTSKLPNSVPQNTRSSSSARVPICRVCACFVLCTLRALRAVSKRYFCARRVLVVCLLSCAEL